MKRSHLCFLSFLCVLLVTIPVFAQEENVTVRVGYRQLTLVPSDFDSLTSRFPVFSTSPVLSELISENNTVFWEDLGQVGLEFGHNGSVSTFAVVQFDDNSFNETLVALSPDNQTLEWTRQANSTIESNYTVIIEAATDYFSREDRYWGLCEEVVVLPGFAIDRPEEVLWKLTFRLVAEGERWTLLFDTAGNLVRAQSWDIPCQSCDNSVWVVLLASFSIVALVVVVLFIRERAFTNPK